jgi:hypothetical protein
MVCGPRTKPPRRLPGSLKALVDDYIAFHRGKELPTRTAYQQLAERKAIDNAARLLVLRKSGHGWKRHPHFHRGWYYGKYNGSFDQAAANLLAARDAIKAASAAGFGHVLAVVTNALASVPGLKRLACYDITELLGYHYGFAVQDIYLHAGTLQGARAIFPAQSQLPSVVRLRAFPSELKALRAFEVEDFLCIFHRELEALRKRGLLP